ncbi:hypothetical protein A2803_04950 [Candidatus Woesebacteria bacterium RIFCSPHIGHO2_01_FULL_44_21]|uniref:Uncharacterized protein n=1 Tax=Candidatus Woesebacteria bacterium RIFCSPHIGHO2_01_FULL_44_21 TaxID=1802503 RepID=A0A1F7Z1J1_9BACT|nr:MAG: hypothetical protein A2803_04950 [Candidatus Woesebacteria bacterium RIFCSPHIGHO2_01_FULL_44_21]OGM70004.1 MAG: hypothetical protein A2897_02365 [Candidatus Woesebacteria bacterium RIFCSPLOWO2_01_FULL_44_24b]
MIHWAMALTKQDKDWIADNTRGLEYRIDGKIDDVKEELKQEMIEHRSAIMNHISSFAQEIEEKRVLSI